MGIRRALTGTILLFQLTSLGANAQDLGDLFKNIGKELEKSAAEQAKAIEDQAREREAAFARTALVSSPNYDLIPSAIVRTTDGDVYQVQFIRFRAEPDLNQIASNFSEIRFFDGRNFEYDLKMTYAIGSSNSTGLTAILQSAANRTLNESQKSEGHARIYSLQGTSIHGEQWALSLEGNRLSRIEFLR